MSKFQRDALDIGITLLLFSVFLIATPQLLLLWLLVIPGVLVWFLAFRMLTWWLTTDLDRWLDSL
jgi:hypothetical protein